MGLKEKTLKKVIEKLSTFQVYFLENLFEKGTRELYVKIKFNYIPAYPCNVIRQHYIHANEKEKLKIRQLIKHGKPLG